MIKLKRKHFWCAAIAGFLAIVMIAVTVVVPIYLNSAGVKNKIQTAVEEKLGGKVSYEKIDISLFPRPQVTIEGLRLAYPRTFRGTLRSLSIVPQILPLFKGRVQFSKIRIQEPDFRIIVPAVKPDSTSEAPTLEEAKENIRSVLGYLQMIGPGLVVEMDNGKFLLRKNHKDFLSLKNVTVHFNAPPGDMHFLVKAGTDQWGDFALSGTYSFTEAQTEIRDVTLSLGHSTLTDYSALLTWDRKPRIEIHSGKAELALHEIYTWLSSSDSLTPFMKELSSLQGTLVITSMQGQGLISEPEKWRMRLTGEARQIELASPRLPAPVSVNYSFAVEDNLVEITELSARMGSSSLSHVSALLTGRDDPVLELRSGNAAINITEVFGWRTWHPALEHLLQGVDTLAGKFTLTELKINGHLYRPEAWRIIAGGALDRIVVQSPMLPGQVGLVKGTFRYVPDKLSFSLKEATILDSTITGTAVVSNITTTVSSIDVTLNGSSGRKTVDWAFENLKLPPELMVKTPLALSDAHLVWQREQGRLVFRDGVRGGRTEVLRGPLPAGRGSGDPQTLDQGPGDKGGAHPELAEAGGGLLLLRSSRGVHLEQDLRAGNLRERNHAGRASFPDPHRRAAQVADTGKPYGQRTVHSLGNADPDHGEQVCSPRRRRRTHRGLR